MKTIMIIENNEAYHNTYKAMLKDNNYKFIHTYDGYEAMEKMDETTPDLIILDMLMDMITGDTFFMYLRNIPEYESIPVIIISSVPERLYRHLRITDPNLAFIEKGLLNRETLIGEMDKKISFPENTRRVVSRLSETPTPGTKSASVVDSSNN
ncbi:MAG: response regulator [Candidatus Brocadiales bacterium]|nr:response regulator [Candidatus Brocadiales bacterium]